VGRRIPLPPFATRQNQPWRAGRSSPTLLPQAVALKTLPLPCCRRLSLSRRKSPAFAAQRSRPRSRFSDSGGVHRTRNRRICFSLSRPESPQGRNNLAHRETVPSERWVRKKSHALPCCRRGAGCAAPQRHWMHSGYAMGVVFGNAPPSSSPPSTNGSATSPCAKPSPRPAKVLSVGCFPESVT